MNAVDELLNKVSNNKSLSAGSLIVTLFCDVVVQHGNDVWLGDLIEIMKPFGLNGRQLRTSVYRLVQDNWLAPRQMGRRSYYSMTQYGLLHYEKAARRIYQAHAPQWDGQWTVVIPAFIFDEQRETVRKELTWLGFGTLSPGMMAHPGADRVSLDETLNELGVANKVVVFNAHTEEVASQACLQRLAYDCWKLNKIENRYQQFNETFQPILEQLSQGMDLDAAQSFYLRILIIHQYRRILLKDSDLPDRLLPSPWAGRRAMAITAAVYKHVQQRAEEFIGVNLRSSEGQLPKVLRAYYQRFDGLE